jgi:hypothetical protein
MHGDHLETDDEREQRIYAFPLLEPCLRRNASWLRYLPFCPHYGTDADNASASPAHDEHDFSSSANDIVKHEVTDEWERTVL